MLGSAISPFHRWLGSAAIAALTVTSGCAHGANADGDSEEASSADIEKLKTRIEELEKTNGRLSVRVDEMDDEIFLLQDRVEAHRLALRRRKQMEQDQTGRARAPSPAPETNYGGEGRYKVRQGNPEHSRKPRDQQPRDEHGYRQPVKRIPLGEQRRDSGPRQEPADGGEADDSQPARRADRQEQNQRGDQADAQADSDQSADAGGEEGESVVITDEDFRKFALQSDDEDASSGGGAESGGDSGSSKAEKPVTDEKLATSQQQQADAEPRPTEPTDGDNPFDGKTGLELYKTALATYRSGEYATALEGFEAFLDGNPREDYQDNGLYWIGECYFGLGEYKTAIEYFQRLLDDQPEGNKVPDAMLKMALAYRELGMSDKARGLLEKLTRRYPSTNAGRLGKKKLSDLES